MRFHLASLVAVAVVALGCSSPDTGSGTANRTTSGPPADTTPGNNDTKPPTDPGTPPDPGTTVGDETWADGKQITSNVTIAAGKTVVIAPGATVTVSSGVSITVQGTLKASANATHAKLTGTDWNSLVIASGGTLTTDSLDIAGAKIAIWTQAGNADATFANGTITATQPFNMEAGSKLSVSKTNATATSESAIAGTFNASYLTYDKGTAEGLYVNDAASTVTLTDSTLKGNGGGDYVVVSTGASLSVSYTTISGSHCPFHFGVPGPAKYAVDHVSDDTNGYGWMLYGSGAGPNTISNSNFRDSTYNIEEKGTNGNLTLTNNFFSTFPAPKKMGDPDTHGNVLQANATVASMATNALPDAHPR